MTPINKKPKAWAGIILSVCFPGLGHLYSKFSLWNIFLYFIPVILCLFYRLLLIKLDPYRVLVFIFFFQLILISTIATHAFLTAKKMQLQSNWKKFGTISQRLIFLICFSISVYFYYAIKPFQAYVLPNMSMMPNLLPGDRIEIVKTFDHFGWPTNKLKYGDIVLHKVKSNPAVKLFKRIIGMPNDIVSIENNFLILNSRSVDKEIDVEINDERFEKFLSSFKDTTWAAETINGLTYPVINHPSTVLNLKPLKLSNNSFLLMRDNRYISSPDELEPFDSKNISGKAVIIYYSADPTTGKIRWNRIGKKL